MVGGDGDQPSASVPRASVETDLEEALDRVTDGFVALDCDWQVTYANRPAGRLVGLPPEELHGAEVWEEFPGLVGTSFERRLRETMATQEPVAFEEHYEPAGVWVAVRAFPSETGLSVYARDVTERHERERTIHEQKQRLRTVVESSDDAIMIKSLEGRYRLVNRTCASLLGRPKSEILGRTDEELFGPERGAELWKRERQVLDAEGSMTYEEELPVGDGTRVFETTRTPYHGPDGDLRGIIGVCRDVTERRGRERELLRYEKLVETSPDPMCALDDDLEVTLVNRALERLLGFDREEVVGEPAGRCVDEGVVAPGNFDRAFELVADLAGRDADGTEKMEVPMRTADDERIDAEFHLSGLEPTDGAGPGGVVGVIRDITGHREQARKIRRQRDELGTLDRINALVQGTIRGLVEAATREEIEETVCRQLAASEFYEFAWIGERRPTGEGVTLRAGVGIDQEELDAIGSQYTEAGMENPAVEVIRTGERWVTQDVQDDAALPATLRESAIDHGTQSGILVPLSHGTAVYGVLGVAANRPDAFSQRELAAFEVLAEAVGFAIDATGNRRLLFGDASVELTLRTADESSLLAAASEALGCRCRVERTVPTADGNVVHYVSVDGADQADVRAFAGARPEVVDLRVVGEDDYAVFEVVSEASVPKQLIDAGASPTEVVAEGGWVRVVVEVPPDVDAESIVAPFRERYADAELLAKHHVERSTRPAREVGQTVADLLTDRQRAVLRAAFHAGYYDWPRKSTAEEVADSLGVASATLHYHLRRAERELLATFLEDLPPE